MEDEQFTNLVNTLLNNNLAGSLNEAKRMAHEMLGTCEKVAKGSTIKEDNYAVTNFEKKRENRIVENIQQTSSYDQQIKEQQMQNGRIPPQLTPENGYRHVATNEIVETNNQINEQPIKQNTQVFTSETFNNSESEIEIPTANTKETSPEEYSAKKFGDFSTMPSMPQSDALKELEGINLMEASNLKQEEMEPNIIIEHSTNERRTTEPVFEPKQENVMQSTPSFNSGFPDEEQNTTTQQESDFIFQGETIEPQKQEEEHLEEVTREMPPPTDFAETNKRKQAQWTEEEKKLKEDVDLSKVFNFSNK